MKEMNIEVLPVLYRGPFNQAEVRKHTGGLTVVGNQSHMREGIVISTTSEDEEKRVLKSVETVIKRSFLRSKE